MGKEFNGRREKFWTAMTVMLYVFLVPLVLLKEKFVNFLLRRKPDIEMEKSAASNFVSALKKNFLGSQQRMKSGTAAEKAAPSHKTAQEKDDFKG